MDSCQCLKHQKSFLVCQNVLNQFLFMMGNTDDTLFILDGLATSLLNAFETLELFSRISGLQVNCAKTKIV